MFMASSSEVSGERAGIEVGRDRHRHAMAAERVDRRLLRLAQEIEAPGRSTATVPAFAIAAAPASSAYSR